MKHWTLDDIPWHQFDAARVDPEVLKLIKGASLVEGNGGDYAKYLCSVFDDDPEFQKVAVSWGEEEIQHGLALGRWAAMADPSFDFDSCFKRFTDGFPIQVDANASIRGSRAGELVARCIVETGTSSYYTALTESVQEPVLKEICRNIAADEFRHYKLFYDHLKRYLERERIGRWRRFLVALGRLLESQNDELAYAYYAANEPHTRYDRRRFVRAYTGRTYPLYQPRHVQRVIGMVLKAIGFKPNGRLNDVLTRWACRFLQFRSQRLARAGI